MSRSEQIGAGAWEMARLQEYNQSAYSKFLCRVMIGDNELTGIIEVWGGGEESRGTLLIPTKAVSGSPLLEEVRKNNAYLPTRHSYYQVAQKLRVNFGQHYGNLLISSAGEAEAPDRLGVTSSLTVSNRFSASASRAREPGDKGAAMGL